MSPTEPSPVDDIPTGRYGRIDQRDSPPMPPKEGRPQQAARRRDGGDPRQGLRRDLGRRALPGGRRHQGRLLPPLPLQGGARRRRRRPLRRDGRRALRRRALPLARRPARAPARLRRLPPRDPRRANSPTTPVCSAPWCRRPTPPTRRSARPASARSSATPPTLEADIAAALAAAGRAADWTPASLALHIQAVLQGAFILAKATGGAQVAADSLGHLRRYLTLLFEPQPQREALS